jgi:predicted DNA-binding transcriptional regulator AlpA
MATTLEKTKQFLRKKQLAERYQCTTRTIDRWVDDGKLPQPIRIGDVPMWDLGEVEKVERAAMKEREQ